MDSFYKMGDDLIVSDSINDERIPFENLKDYCLHIICYHGKGEIRMNDRLFVMEKNNLIVCPAGTNIHKRIDKMPYSGFYL